MKRVVLVVLVLSGSLLSGCNKTEIARGWSTNKWASFTIQQYSGGKLIGEWVATERPISETSSDGFAFVNKATGKLLIVSGDIRIEEMGK